MNKLNLFLIYFILLFCILKQTDIYCQSTKELRVPLIEQQDAKWCWAADLEMIFKYHSNPKDTLQCDIVETYYRTSSVPRNKDCKCVTSCGDLTKNCRISVWNTAIKSLMSNYKYGIWNIDSPFVMTWTNAKAKIDNFRPFIISHEMGDCRSTHYLTAKGYCEKSGCNFLLVNDPGICKKQNIVAVKYNTTSSLKICTAVVSNEITPSNVNAGVVVNSNICSAILSCDIFDIKRPIPMIILNNPKPPFPDSLNFDSLKGSILVEYIRIENNKIIKVNTETFRDVITKDDSDSSSYFINRVALINNKWETQMILKGRNLSKNKDKLQVDPVIKIGKKVFTLDRGLYKKVVLLPDYDDYIQFKYKGKDYFYPLNYCNNCKPIVLKRNLFIKDFINNNNIIDIEPPKSNYKY
jgi:hypothetical protein